MGHGPRLTADEQDSIDDIVDRLRSDDATVYEVEVAFERAVTEANERWRDDLNDPVITT
jgi:hypothetical protein